jgi:hypothetical protein
VGFSFPSAQRPNYRGAVRAAGLRSAHSQNGADCGYPNVHPAVYGLVA